MKRALAVCRTDTLLRQLDGAVEGAAEAVQGDLERRFPTAVRRRRLHVEGGPLPETGNRGGVERQWHQASDRQTRSDVERLKRAGLVDAQHDRLIDGEAERQHQRAVGAINRCGFHFDAEYELTAVLVALLLGERALLLAVLLRAVDAPVAMGFLQLARATGQRLREGRRLRDADRERGDGEND